MTEKEFGGLSLGKAIEQEYLNGADDYHMPPLCAIDKHGKPIGTVQNGDSVIFCCRRGEREIELTEMFTEKGANLPERKLLDDIYFVPLTLYHDKFKNLPVAFAPEKVQDTLAETVSKAGKTQFHCAESEKFAHITFFLNGGNNAPFPGEDDVKIPSPKNIDFDKVPELSLEKVTDTVISALGKYDLIAVNFANGDVIGHTSSCEAKLMAAECVSNNLNRLVEAGLKENYTLLVTADHGNLERMINAEGKPDVAHTENPVYCLLIDPERTRNCVLNEGQSLASVAPTVLQLMGIDAPRKMKAPSLLPENYPRKERKVVLVVLDGWGIGKNDQTNPIYLGETKKWDELLLEWPHTQLNASGSFVGLGEGKAGNSEAGHMNLGAGRCAIQDDQRLEKALKEGSFEKNSAFVEAIQKAEKNHSALHLITLLTHKSSHGDISYAEKLCSAAGEIPVYLHIILDGRSTENGSAPDLLHELNEKISGSTKHFIVSAVGRGIALDRDGNYDKVKKAYDSIVEGIGKTYLLET